MTSTANNSQQQPTPEHPLTWKGEKKWGSEGLTHQATTEINGERWTFIVDQPSKGYWVARAWRNGTMALYREDKTMKGAKGQAQAHANRASTSTCPECRGIEGHSLGCGTGRQADVEKDAARGTRITLRDEGAELLNSQAATALTPEILEQLDADEAAQLMTELEETFPHLVEWKSWVAQSMQRVMTDAGSNPSASDAMAAMDAAVARVQSARDRVQFRKDTCGCLSPLHTMRCGVGGRATVIRPAVTA